MMDYNASGGIARASIFVCVAATTMCSFLCWVQEGPHNLYHVIYIYIYMHVYIYIYIYIQ